MPSLAFDIRIRIRHVAQDVAPTLDVDQTSLLRATDAFIRIAALIRFKSSKRASCPALLILL